jgi:hypothetical protein
MASQGYWTSDDSSPAKGLKKYHLFLDGIYRSSSRHIKLVNQNLTACLDFGANYTNPKPLVCHPIKESDIPRTDDSILDAGYFVVSDKLNESKAEACVQLGYHNWYNCNSQTIDANSYYNSPKLLSDMGIIYNDVFANDACITEHHLKEGTKDFDFCEKMLS